MSKIYTFIHILVRGIVFVLLLFFISLLFFIGIIFPQTIIKTFASEGIGGDVQCEIKPSDEFRINTYNIGVQSNAAIAVSQIDGSVVAVWNSEKQDGSGYGIFAQRFDKNGKKLGSEFRINTYISNNQIYAQMDMATDGSFVVTWTSDLQDGSGMGVYAQRFDKNGNKLGSEFRANTYTFSHQYGGDIAMDSNGNFVITWMSEGQDGSDYGIFAQRFDKNGNRLGGEFRVNSNTRGLQAWPTIASFRDGNFIIIWGGISPDNQSVDVFAQRFDKNGNKLGNEFLVNTQNLQWIVNIHIIADSGFIITGHNYIQDGTDVDIFAQRFDRNGNRVGREFRVNGYTAGIQIGVSIASFNDGSFIIAWMSFWQEGDGSDAFAQHFDKDGNKLGTEFQINTYTKGYQHNPQIAAIQDEGSYITVWEGDGVDSRENFDYNIYSKFFYNICQDKCQNGIKDQYETDIDCGNGCSPCINGLACNVNSDCQSQFCNPNRICSVPTCTDGWRNGNETEVDCGGSCPSCQLSILYVPVNWDTAIGVNDYQNFVNRALGSANLIEQSLPLSQCTNQLQILLPSPQGSYGVFWDGWQCPVETVQSQNFCVRWPEVLMRINLCAKEYENVTHRKADYVVGLVNRSLHLSLDNCSREWQGMSNGITRAVIVETPTTPQPQIVLHELGHTWGFKEQYCDYSGFLRDLDPTNDLQAGRCGPTAIPNPLNSALGCRSGAGNGCCQNYNALGNSNSCLGNLDRIQGSANRTIMAAGPNQFDQTEYNYLSAKSKFQCRVTQKQLLPLALDTDISFSDAMLDVALEVYKNDEVRLLRTDIGFGNLPIFDSTSGDYTLYIKDSVGNILYQKSMQLYFSVFYPGQGLINLDKEFVLERMPYNQSMNTLELYHGEKLIFKYQISTTCNQNNICDTGESFYNCPQDCLSYAKDNLCNMGEDGGCDLDCYTDTDLDCRDSDGDTIIDISDNCPTVSNSDQKDFNNNGVGDLCEPFRRADSNGDGTVDISDAINTLGFLFLGTGKIDCMDAGDANDDGDVDISDAIRTLGWLFTGDAVPPAPGPFTPGVDPTADALTCDQYPAPQGGGAGGGGSVKEAAEAIDKSTQDQQTKDNLKNVLNIVPKGTLSASSDPTGAYFYLDGKYKGYTGLTPITIKDLYEGSYTVKFTKYNYETYQTTIKILPGQTTNIKPKLKSLTNTNTNTNTNYNLNTNTNSSY